MEIRVVMPDVEGAQRLLAVVFDESSLSFDRAHTEVRVHSEWESRAVVQVLDAVEARMEAGGASSAKLWPRNRYVTVVGPVPIATVS